MKQILEAVTDLAAAWELPLRWAQKQGSPVAMVDISSLTQFEGVIYRLEAIEIRQDELTLAGKTTLLAPPIPKVEPPQVNRP